MCACAKGSVRFVEGYSEGDDDYDDDDDFFDYDDDGDYDDCCSRLEAF